MVKNPATKDWHLRPNHALDERVEDLIFLTKFALKISKTLNSAIKIGILKMLSKNYVSSTHTATLII